MLRIGSFVWGVRDIPRAVEFWCAALDFEPREQPGEDSAVLVPHDRSGLQLGLDFVTSDRARRHHLDLYADDRAAEVERLLGLGASRIEGWVYEDDAEYIVLADPDGNPFCVVQR